MQDLRYAARTLGRLVVLNEDISAAGGLPRAELTPATYVEWKALARSFEDIAALVPATFNLTVDGEPERLDGIRTTTNLFSLLGASRSSAGRSRRRTKARKEVRKEARSP